MKTPEPPLQIDEDDYPFCVPSYSPCITDHRYNQTLLQDSERFSETKCDILEASASGIHRYRNVNDEGLLKLLAESKLDGQGRQPTFRTLIFRTEDEEGPWTIGLSQATAKTLFKNLAISPQAAEQFLGSDFEIPCSRTTYDECDNVNTYEIVQNNLIHRDVRTVANDDKWDSIVSIMSYDFKSCTTTYLILAPAKALRVASIHLRLQQYHKRYWLPQSGNTQGLDPFCLHRIVMSNIVRGLGVRLVELTDEASNMFEETEDYIKKPDQLTKRTFELYRLGIRLRMLMNLAEYAEQSLKEISVGSSWLNQHLEPKMSASAVESAKEDLEYLRCASIALTSDVSFWEKNKNDMANLVNNLVSQNHSHSATIIARETRKDSSSMKTIAALTMLFLPATFIATVFGMSFFDYSDHGILVSGHWWLYVVITVPTTLLIFIIWLAWNPEAEPLEAAKGWSRRSRPSVSFRKLPRTAYKRLGLVLRRRVRGKPGVNLEAHSLHEV